MYVDVRLIDLALRMKELLCYSHVILKRDLIVPVMALIGAWFFCMWLGL